MKGVVAIVGRPNVGKSTLFNRLIERRDAIVDDRSGITRDRNFGSSEWTGRGFDVIDTGGYVSDSDDVVETAIREQVLIAMEDADVILFVVDGKVGLLPDDEAIAQLLRRNPRAHVLLVVNKVDNYQRQLASNEFYGLGFEELFPISAMSGSGTGELLDKLVSLLPPADPELDAWAGIPRLAIVGKPNVGKSSMVNALLDKASNIVTPIAGTTRDSVHTHYKAFGFEFILIDTAGLRRKAKVQDQIEFYSTIRTLKAIQESTVVMVMLDATEGIQKQDLHIISTVARQRKGLIIVVNKWDISPEKDTEAYRRHIESRIAPLRNVPIIFTSATEKLRIHKAMQAVQELVNSRKRKIPTHELNDYLLPLIEQRPPASQRGKLIRIKFVTQADAGHPTFVFFANHPKLVKEEYRRFLENRIREKYGFDGWPVSIHFREK
jgi:GTP-binding protein